jgi:hypothetical protein
MGIHKRVEEHLVVSGDRDVWLVWCGEALLAEKFKNVNVDLLLGQASGEFTPVIGTLYGDLIVTAEQDGSDTRLEIKAIANVDNVYALGCSPGAALIEMLKEGLHAIPGAASAATGSLVLAMTNEPPLKVRNAPQWKTGAIPERGGPLFAPECRVPRS